MDRAGRLTGLEPIVRADARVLVLGSMPSRESLRKREYYGHAQNLFWPFMTELFGAEVGLSYARRCALLRARGVALWDVARACRRDLSADATMREVEPNDFAVLFARCRRLRAIFFNGRKAEDLFAKLVLPGLAAAVAGWHREWLPSTSPANAAIPRAVKLARWRAVEQRCQTPASPED